MIWIKEGNIEIAGTVEEVRADYTIITKAVRNSLAKMIGKENADKELDKMVALAKMEIDDLVEACSKGATPEEKEELKSEECTDCRWQQLNGGTCKGGKARCGQFVAERE